MSLENYILVHDPSNNFPYLNLFEKENIIEFVANSPLKGDELIAHYSKRVMQVSNDKKVVIDFEIYETTPSYNTAIRLAAMLRLDGYNGDLFTIDQYPLNLTSISPLDFSIFKLNTFRDITYTDAFQEDEKNGNYRINQFRGKRFDLDEFIHKLEITPSKDRHQASNEWGALKLAMNAGYSANEIGFKFPQTLYFKLLQKKVDINYLSEDERKDIVNDIKKKIKEQCSLSHDKLDFSSLLQKNKVLLIDDNADNGWQSVINKIFPEAEVSSQSFLMGVAKKDRKGKWELTDDLEKYDLILLDLYLPENGIKSPSKNNGLVILELMKEKFPAVPAIIFTASNKSWTLDEITQLGADGMYVKEAPEYAGDKEYSKGNFESFVKTTIKTLNKYRVLRPYWEAIDTLINQQTFRKIKEKTNDRTKFKERIAERLKMFYGLLKRGFEQNKYDEENFFFSDYELAFMTLWSVLNEISEAFYDKEDKTNEFELEDGNGNQHTCTPPRNNKFSNWKVRETSDYLVKHDYELVLEDDGSPRMINDSFPALKSIGHHSFIDKDKEFETFIIPDTPGTRLEVTREISAQIGYLIRKYFEECASDVKDRHCRNLYRLNNIRNKMYLTHGDFIRGGFYSKTEKEKRGDEKNPPEHKINPEGDIKDLFEIVAFLLTGENIAVNIPEF